MPYRLVRGIEPALEWCYTGDLAFTDPFFSDTITLALRRPYAAVFQRRTTFSELAALCEASESLAPLGFIFHMSRCGSTLISRTLSAIPELLVLSEPPPLDSVLRAEEPDEHVTLTLRALARRRSDKQRGLIVKVDCWNIFQFERMQRVFPGVPCVFIHRNPAEVLASQMIDPGAWTLPGVLPASLFGLREEESTSMPRAGYCARIIGAICETAAGYAESGRILPIDYADLPDAVFTRIVRHFGLNLSAETLARMRDVARFDAKRPSSLFEKRLLTSQVR